MNTRIHIAAIYAARTHPEIRAELPAERSRDFCPESCYAARGGDPLLCDDGGCWAEQVAARSPILCSSSVYAQRRLQVERGRAPAPRPRSIAALARTHYTNHGGPR